MSIIDAIAKAKDTTPSRGRYKTFYVWYDALSQEDREALDAALLSPEISIRQLFDSLKTHENVPWGDNAIYYHARSLKQGR